LEDTDWIRSWSCATEQGKNGGNGREALGWGQKKGRSLFARAGPERG
jgi:hypothetical protein